MLAKCFGSSPRLENLAKIIEVVHFKIFYDLNDFLTQELMQTTVCI